MSPIFATYKTLNYELMVQDLRGVNSVSDVFYFGRLFLSENAFIEFDVLLWAFGKEMPFMRQYFHR